MLLTSCCLWAAAPALAAAQERTAFPADFYRVFAPRNALDMVARTPGFTLQEGDERRGYAGSLGNVLIDGRRPAGKSQTLKDALQLIPASQVLRIEMLAGAEAAGDPSGYAMIVNVVRTPSAGQGFWSAGAEIANRGRPAPSGSVSWSGRRHDTNYSLGAQTYSLQRDLPGTYKTFDEHGQEVGEGREASPRVYDEYALNGSLDRPVADGALSLTGKLKYSRYHEDTTLASTSAVGAASQVTPYTETYRIDELGAQYDRQLGPWALSAIGLFNRTRFSSAVTAIKTPDDSRFDQEVAHRSAENILRASLARGFGQHRVELGYEHARNSLRAQLALTFAQGGTSFPIEIPDSNALIMERREDLYVSDLWRLTPDLTGEARLGYERSELAFRGDTNARVRYGFFKPSVTLTRRFGANQLAFRVYRDIGQIDFDDFVSTASLKDAVIDGGNPALRTQTQWRAELTGDVRFGPRTTLTLKLYHSALRDTADLTPIQKDGAAYDAPGNIGDGAITGASVSLHLPLDRLIPGGSMQIDLMGQTTRVTDPVTGRKRIISALARTTHAVSFRQDVPRRHLAWGLDYTDASSQTKFKLAETDTTQDASTLNLYVERNALGPYSLRLALNALNNPPASRQRVFYARDRDGAVERVEAQKRLSGSWLNVTLSRPF
ncbi:hypothetical protein [Caulobacter sp. UNC358MFTsu5.1]|uniref:hypothetical protein n=1 Tax=Caulobacter sp. UNC358MFTsu5.1 TaxID=1449049 RepID=UPI0012DE36B5|nr:hypothetical protein [Caulobacter sp. UNC358MFTsu5.1]